MRGLQATKDKSKYLDSVDRTFQLFRTANVPKCTGSPSPCSVCIKADTYCCFNPKVDTQRKAASSVPNLQERQQFMITALLQTLKHSPEEDLTSLLRLIRESSSSQPDIVAERLQDHFTTLQTNHLLPKFAFDRSDVSSFALQGLCESQPSSSTTENTLDLSSPNSEISSAGEIEISDHEIINKDNELELQYEDLAREQSPNMDEITIPPEGLVCAEMFHVAVRVPSQNYDGLNALYQGCEKAFRAPLKLSSLRADSRRDRLMPTATTADSSFTSYDGEYLLPACPDFPMMTTTTPYFTSPGILNYPTQTYFCNSPYPGFMSIDSPTSFHTFPQGALGS